MGPARYVGGFRTGVRRTWVVGMFVVAATLIWLCAEHFADALVATWTADAAVVTEPTGLEIAVGHKGFAWIDVEVRGRAAHGSRPADGQDAIKVQAVKALEEMDRARGVQVSAPPPMT